MAQTISTQISGSVELNDTPFSWSLWNGESLGDCIAIDTETTLIEDRHRVPELCLVSISDGQQHLYCSLNGYQNSWKCICQTRHTWSATTLLTILQ